MNYRMICFVISRILLMEAALLALPMAVAFWYGESGIPYLIPMALLILCGLPLGRRRPERASLYARDGLAVVALAWIAVSLFGAMPFYISGSMESFVDCIFETVSGFTTTGASILREVESLNRGILFWRSFTHWVGGMGVLVFVMAIVPMSGDGHGMHLLRAEVPGPSVGKLVSRMSDSAKILYGIYFVITVVEILLLLAGGMPYLANLRYEEEPSRQYLTDLFNSVQLKDIVKRNKIRDIDLLERIIAYMTANVGTVFSASSLAKFFKNEQRTVAAETILNYVRYCCDAYLFYQVKRQDLQGKQILASNEKYYIADHGIREAVFGGNMKDINLILENIVYMELLRRGYVVTVGRAGEKEIDFVCEKRGEKLYVQVTYLLASEDTVKREFGAYDGIQDNFPKYVVSLDEFDMSRNGIKHRNIRDFLLAEEWN